MLHVALVPDKPSIVQTKCHENNFLSPLVSAFTKSLISAS